VTLPIEPMRRHEHYVTASATADDLPFVKDFNGLAIHAHSGGFSIGLVNFDHPGGEDFSVDAPTSPGSSSPPPPTGSAACPASSSSGSGPASTTRTASTATQ
jgi:hypothetical protein